jgi:hypothetical protein
MDMLPQLPPHQGNRVRKGGVRFTIPRRVAHAGRSLLDQQLSRQRDDCVGFFGESEKFRALAPAPWGTKGT